MSQKTILLLGLCAKISPDGGLYPPLSQTSRSGGYLSSLLESMPLSTTRFRRDNIIPGPVVRADGKERNPTWLELLPSLRQHWLWMDETLAGVVVFGGEAKRAFSALREERQIDVKLHFFHHPSYALRQPRESRVDYANKLARAVVATDKAA